MLLAIIGRSMRELHRHDQSLALARIEAVGPIDVVGVVGTERDRG